MTHPPDVLAPEPSTPVTGLAPLLGTLLGGRYRIDAVLGHGGMADVYRAQDERIDRPVAVKLFRPGADGHGDRARFKAEVHTLAALSHANLVALFDSGQDVQRPWCVMQYVDGGTLADAGQLPPDRVARIGAEICEALDYIHRLGIVHRDVKPSNVLLDSDGTAYLSDFGVAQIIDATRMTASGALLGTAAYLSPEQVLGKPATEAVDVYALALVLLETITGTREYPGGPIESAVARLSRPPELPGWLGAEWSSLLRAMTEVEPTDRPAAAEVAARLRALARQSVPPRPLAIGRPSPGAGQPGPTVPASGARPLATGRLAGRPLEELSDGTRTVRPIDRFRAQSRAAIAVESGALVAATVLGFGVLVPLLTGAGAGSPQGSGDTIAAVAVSGAASGSAAAPSAALDPEPSIANTVPDGQPQITIGPRRGASGPLRNPSSVPISVPSYSTVYVTVAGSVSASVTPVKPSPTASVGPSTTPTVAPSVSTKPSSSPTGSTKPSTSPTTKPSVSSSPKSSATASVSPDPGTGNGGGAQAGGAQGGAAGAAGGPRVTPSPSGA